MFGIFMVEDLWNMKLEGDNSLDSIAVDLKEQLDGSADSIVAKLKKDDVAKENKVLNLKFKIAEDILITRVKEKKRKDAAERLKAKRAEIARIIKDKKQSAMHDMSIEDLEKLMNEDIDKDIQF